MAYSTARSLISARFCRQHCDSALQTAPFSALAPASAGQFIDQTSLLVLAARPVFALWITNRRYSASGLAR
ncbi:hypothetical protein [Bradyrhizobium sp. STM 3557]|uniref:hypothetical protein n=1 Tax=Bradyrhizobium sp. STM 3557 TaxID=578920 RepID=UPI00388F10EF